MDWVWQRELAMDLALAPHHHFSVQREVLEQVKVFKYLGRLMAQDDDDIRAARNQLKKARSTWAHVGQVLCSDCIALKVATMFYKAVVQAVLLYGSKTWNLSKTVLARLEGFHIRVAYKMAVKHRPKQGPGQTWI